MLATRVDGAVMRVSIKNPPVNLLNISMVKELFGLVGRLTVDPSIKVVVFDSAVPDFFIAHFDATEFKTASTDPAARGRYDEINILQSLSTCLGNLPQITIAEVTGVCRGGGLDLVLGMTMRFASRSARFCAPETSVGFLPCGGGMTRLAMMCGPARALEVSLSGRDFSGEEAQQYGIVNQALADDELRGYVDSLARRIALRPAYAIASTRGVIKRVFAPMADSLFEGFAAENDAMRVAIQQDYMQRANEAVAMQGQTRENEIDLPATIHRVLASMQTP
ncbi:enoyl-CoA hydratase/isomerase family protein [Cupriavidus nantongensis]|uniref:enoyl-CoA hydratase/isomerase family protein n=1 Tax=Cupriavidus nantongensis TaxID=1796606 RepID=UPI0018D4B9D2|nr:enoyl-CoA hydratase/isomerase family protein [Cupriavidus nantongensis]